MCVVLFRFNVSTTYRHQYNETTIIAQRTAAEKALFNVSKALQRAKLHASLVCVDLRNYDTC